MSKWVRVNVGGTKYKLDERYLRKYPGTLLSNKENSACYYDDEKDEYFFDRDPDMFKYVCRFYITGKLHCPFELELDCWVLYRDEMNFYGIPMENATSDCCIDDYLAQNYPEKEEKRNDKKRGSLGKTKAGKTLGFRAKIRETMNNPHSSKLASVFHIFTAIIILVSVSSNVLETLPCSLNKTCAEEYTSVFFSIEVICIVIFTAEYIGGVLVALSRWQHIRDPLNIIDLMAILPFYFNIIFEQFVAEDQGQGTNQLQGMSVLRIFRIFRILKFARYSHKLQYLFKSLRKSSSELSFILFSYSLTIVLFSSIMFYMEKDDEKTTFQSIPSAMWYSIVTTTTLGYGDMVPVTYIGKIIGGFCCLFGAVIISLPVPVIQAKAKGLIKAGKKDSTIL